MTLNDDFTLTPQLSIIRIEAEDMNLTNYKIRSSDFASGGDYIKREGSATEGSASTNFNGETGNYDLKINYYDKDTGASQLTVKVGGQVIDTWTLDQQLGPSPDFFSSRTIATNLEIKAGDTIEIFGTKDGKEKSAVDYIEFIPHDGDEAPTPTPEPEPEPEPSLGEPIRIEAEDMDLSSYKIVSKSFASGENYIKRRGNATEGSASTNFSGETGTYNINLGYYDQDTGASQLTLKVGGKVIESWTLDQELGNGGIRPATLVSRAIATDIPINTGDTIEIVGTKDGKETSAVDYIEFIPTDSNDGPDVPPSGGAGITVDLGFEPIKIMPLGDSITLGVEASKEDIQGEGGYRDKLANKFQETGINVDFVGYLSDGPDGFDSDHNGYGGKTIDWLASNNWSSKNGHPEGLKGSLAEEQPDIILAMAGTNDSNNDTVDKMIEDLDNLIDKITRLSPDTQLFVSTIPPIRADVQSAARAQRAEDYNDAIPGVVDSWASQGKNVSFVDMTSLTTDDISLPEVDNGLHPNDAGYEKIANLWYDAVANVVGDYQNADTHKATGKKTDDTLIGNSDDNIIKGNGGWDNLTGGGGRDIFVYKNPNQGFDTITDFSDDDIFRITAAKFGGGLQADVSLSNGTASATGVLVQGDNPEAIGTSGNFLYNTSSGLLSFDVDGTGSQSAMALVSLEGQPSLSVEQFDIV